MQSFTCFVIVAALATVAAAASIGQSQQLVAQNILQTLSEEGNLNNAPAELSRLRKSTYGSAPSVPSVPCPKNYLFSCQPNVAPVACAQPQHGYAGAYSAPVPTYAVPQVSGPGIPRELLRPIRNLNQFYY